jgi:transcriptional regulator with XRE-family HTH domain
MDRGNLAASSDDYVASLHRRLGLELADRRAALGLSAYALGKAAGVTDQTILNLERGLAKNGCWTATLARLCLCFGVSVAEFVEAAERRCLVMCPLVLTLT